MRRRGGGGPDCLSRPTPPTAPNGGPGRATGREAPAVSPPRRRRAECGRAWSWRGLREMVAQPANNVAVVGVVHLVSKLLECKVDDVVVMHLLRRNQTAHLEPDAVQEIDILAGESRR